MTIRDRFHESLTRVCLCAGANVDAFCLTALRGEDELIRVWWHDSRTGLGRRLGRPLAAQEAQEILPGLFMQLRAWRAARRPLAAHANVMAAGATR